MNRVLILERCLAMDHRNMMMLYMVGDHLTFLVDNNEFAIHEVFDREVFFQRIVNPIQAALLQTGEI